MSRQPPPPIELLSVRLASADGARPVGTLAWKRDQRVAYFEYHRDFLASSLPLSPFHLPPRPGAIAAPASPFEGLHGLFNDSLPDGWGRRLLDRRLHKAGLDHRALTPLDRLAYVGESGMGALRFVPEKRFGHPPATELDLDQLAGDAQAIQNDADTVDLDQLQAVQGGSGGARPKVMVGFDPKTRLLLPDTGAKLPGGFDPWIVKFPSAGDPASIGAEEYAYSLMARAAGIDMPETTLIETHSGARFFAIRRFDRTPAGPRHIHSASGLLNADHRAPSIDYEDLLKLTRALTRDARHVRQMFRRMVFNLFAHNRDDHAKNHAFVMTPTGDWSPTPAYDLTFSDGPGGEHNLAIAGEGRAPTLAHVRKVAADAAVPPAETDAILATITRTVADWPEFAAQAGLAKAPTTAIRSRLSSLVPAA